MTDQNKSKGQKEIVKRIRQSWRQAAFLLCLLLFVLVTGFIDRDAAKDDHDDGIPAHEGWVSDSGRVEDLYDLPSGDFDLSLNVSEFSTGNQSLCLKSIDTVFDVYADGEIIYSYHPQIPRRLGKSYGMYVHTIPVPENTGILSLHLEPVFAGTEASLSDVVIGNGGQYMSSLFRKNLLAFGISSEIVLIGLLFFSIGVFGRVLAHTVGLDFVSFGLLCILIGFIGFNDTLILQVLTKHPSLIRVITYSCLIVLPYPALAFFAGATGNGGSGLVPAFFAISLIDFLTQILLTYHGISDYYYLVYVSHGIIIFSFIAIIYLIVTGVKNKTIKKGLLHSLVIGLSVLVAGTIADFLRYYFMKSHGASGYTRLGIWLFTFLIGIYLFRGQIEALKQKQQENMTFISEITTAFARVIDMKDSYTNGHSSRVAKYTAMLTRELGYDEETVEKYYRIALLHDIGKIGVPKSVLNKPGKLTDEEYEIIKSHASLGYDALKDISIMPELATGAGSHHERPDGQGYPNHLAGEEIPRVAQIIAVADCFDAMYSNRPYRKRMNFDKAVSIIKEVSGTQLTTDVVDAFLRLVDKGEFRDPGDQGGGTTENIDNVGKM